jgi:hypothetical protein
LSYQKIPETAYKVSADLKNGNIQIMQEDERHNRRKSMRMWMMMMMMMITMTTMTNDDDNDDRCLQCATVSECK